MKSDFINFFHDFIHGYSPRAGGRQPPGDKVLMSPETSCHFGHLLLCVCQHFQTSPLKPLGRLKANFIMEPPWDWGRKVCSNGPGHMTKVAAMPIYGKNLKKNLLLHNPKADDLETWYTALGARVLSRCSNDDPGLALTYFTAMSNLVPNAFVWESCKTMDFSETIVVNSSRSRTRLSHFSRGIWEIHAEYTCFLSQNRLYPTMQRENPRGLYEISFPLTRMVVYDAKVGRCS